MRDGRSTPCPGSGGGRATSSEHGSGLPGKVGPCSFLIVIPHFEVPMRRSRVLLLLSSLAVVVFLLGSGAALKAGAGDGTFRQMLLFSEILSYAVDNYVDPVDTDKLMRGAHEGLMSGLDPHGAYLTTEDVELWKRGSAAPADSADPGLTVLRSGPVIQVVSVAA